MKKLGRKLVTGTAMLVSAATISACGADNTNVCVYGPPPAAPEVVSDVSSANTEPSGLGSGKEDPSSLSPTSKENEQFDPSNEINDDVYGPPSSWE